MLALLAILGPSLRIDSWSLVLVEGISAFRQGEQSRAHSEALNVFGVWIKTDLRGGDAAQFSVGLPVATVLLRPAPAFLHPCVMACSWLNPSCQRFEGIPRNPCPRRAPGRTAATYPRDQSSKAGRVVGQVRQVYRRKQSSQQLPASQIGQER